MTDYKQLCAELAAIEDALSGGAAMASNQGQALDGYSALANFRSVANRARAALAEPAPEGPTNEELYDLLDWLKDEWHSNNEGEFPLPLYACAVLARWGRHPGSPDSSTQPS